MAAHPRLLRLAPAAAALAALLPGAARGQDAEAGRPVAPPPHAEGRPVEVALGVYILQVSDVNQLQQTFSVDGYLAASWRDPRLAFDAAALGSGTKEYHNQHALDRLGEDVWWPSIEFLNADTGGDLDRHWLTVDSAGNVGLSTRFSATVTSEMDLRRFPYDTQTLRIPIESYFHGVDDVVFTVDEGSTGFDGTHELPEWHLVDDDARIDVHDYGQYGDFYGRYSRFTFELRIGREHPFYAWKVFLPLALIIVASWAAFWIRDDSIMEVAFGLLLTLVAFQFAVADSVPKVPYMTFMDVVMTLSYLTVGLSIPILIAVRQRDEAEHGLTEQRLLRLCRIGFPLVYCVLLLVAIGVML